MHPSTSCLQLAIDRKAFSRALRVQGNLNADAVIQFVEQDLNTLNRRK